MSTETDNSIDMKDRLRELTAALKENTDALAGLRVDIERRDGSMRLSVTELTGRVSVLESALATTKGLLTTIVGSILLYIVGHALNLKI